MNKVHILVKSPRVIIILSFYQIIASLSYPLQAVARGVAQGGGTLSETKKKTMKKLKRRLKKKKEEKKGENRHKI